MNAREEITEKPVKGYVHSKTGEIYFVMGIGKHSETQEEMVIYRRSDIEDAPIWIRPLNMWFEETEHGPRFVEHVDDVRPEN